MATKFLPAHGTARSRRTQSYAPLTRLIRPLLQSGTSCYSFSEGSMTAKKAISLNPSWYHLFILTAVACVLIAGLLRSVFDRYDSMHCHALLSTGSWLDSAYRNWQPEGCMLYPYAPGDASQCLSSSRVVFVGDSVTRGLFFQFIHIVDPTLPKEPPNDGAKHSDHSFVSGSQTRLDFVWDPFLNTTATLALMNSSWKRPSDLQSERPALLVLGSGLWYLRYADASGGLPAWEANIEAHIEALNGAPNKPADEVVFLPVEEVVPSKLSPERLNTMHSSDIDAMNSDLYHRIKPLATSSWVHNWGSAPSARISFPLVFNKMLDDSQTQDGLHFTEAVIKAQANILLNLRCNDEWPKTFPMDKTCCQTYPWPGPAQSLVLVCLLLYTCISLYYSYSGNWVLSKERLPVVIFGAVVNMAYLADRTGLWLKEQKQFSPWTFGFLCFVSLAAGFATIRRADKDLGFLNRDQTDEWKGWMQVVILIYHYLGASKISGIYNPIRVLVAAYLFMTGYGHTTFYLKKADFGYLRVFQILVRLNLLTLTLSYTMNADYLSYYFAPLVSMWFLIVYLTLWVGSQHNDNVPFLVVKMLLSMGAFGAFIHQTWLLEGLFKILERVFFIHWSAHEWAFRVSLDQYIVYCGMFAALAVIKIRNNHLTEHPLWPAFVRISIGMSATVLVWFMRFELVQESKFAYNAWHPYISFLPILAFVTLRNASPTLRSYSSRIFAFIGRCSLETFVVQFHLWLAADTKGILVLIPGVKWRALNFVLSTTIFIYLSHQVAWATGEITGWICNKEKDTLPTARETSSTQALNAAGAHSETLPLASANDSLARSEMPSGHHPKRWLDKLAEGTGSRRSPNLFKAWSGIPQLDAKGKMMVWGGLMWLANTLWTDT